MDVGWMTRAPLAALATGDPDAPALHLEDTATLTYRELHARQSELANGLLALGVTTGDRVGILMRNDVDYACLYFAIARIGAVAVRLNFRLTAAELGFALGDSGCVVLCLQPEFIGRIAEVADEAPVRTYVTFGAGDATGLPGLVDADTLRAHGDHDPGVPLPSATDPVMLMYTSGTTGFPKAAVWTHETAVGCVASQALEYGYDSSTVAMTTGPLYHAGGFETLLLPALAAQGQAVCMSSGAFDVGRVARVIAARGVTDVMLFPFMIYDLLRLPEFNGDRLPTLRRVLTGGDPITPSAIEQITERLPDVEIMQGYGLTEATQSTSLRAADAIAHPASVGRPFPFKEVKVVGEDGAELAAGEVGEIWIRGAGVVRTYWNRPEESQRAFTDGWLHTGDLGRVDHGLLFLAGRKKDMIRSGGENISPLEVEAVLASHPTVSDVAVVAVPDARYTEVGCAVVVPADGAELDAAVLRALCRERLAAYKCPKHFVAVGELPRNASGKVLKLALRDRFAPVGRA